MAKLKPFPVLVLENSSKIDDDDEDRDEHDKRLELRFAAAHCKLAIEN